MDEGWGIYRGSQVRGKPPKDAKKPCVRCGRLRRADGGTKEGMVRSGLCRDCRSVLTPEELALWKGEDAQREETDRLAS